MAPASDTKPLTRPPPSLIPRGAVLVMRAAVAMRRRRLLDPEPSISSISAVTISSRVVPTPERPCERIVEALMLAELVDLDMTGGIAPGNTRRRWPPKRGRNRNSTCDFVAAPWWCESCGAISNLARYNNACEKNRRRCVASRAVAEGPATQVIVRRDVAVATLSRATLRCLAASSPGRAVGHRRGAMSCRSRCRSSSSATLMAALHRAAQTTVDASSQVRENYGAYRTAHDIARTYRDEMVRWRRSHRRGVGASLQRILIGVFGLLADSRDQELVEVVPDPEVEDVGGLARGRHGTVQGRGRWALVAP